MTESPMKKIATPVFMRSMHRTWTNASGRIVTAQQEAPKAPTVKTVKWEASVVDTATDHPIESYPTLTGETTVTSDVDSDREVTTAYINKCRFVDGEKPNVTLLQQNLNAGLWDIDIKTDEPVTA
jgi:hypothetical protein